MKKITLLEVEYVAHSLAQKLLEYDEPIPPFVSRFPGRLESCLASPFHTYNGKSLYPTMLDKAAILFYLMNKNHPFKNGNKRVAVTTLLYFLSEQNKWLRVDPHELYKFALFVADSPAKYQKDIVGMIKKFLKNNVVAFRGTIKKTD